MCFPYFRAMLLAGCLACASPLLHAGGPVMSTASESARTYAWRRILDHGSFEHASVVRHGNAISIEGDILATHDGKPLRVTYALATDDDSISRSLTLEQEFDGEVRRLTLARADDGRWWINGILAPELAGCSDIDLGLSPSTNALPIGRMLSAGAAGAEVSAAWVRFPSLEVTPAIQRYTRLAARTWRYESLASGFTALLEVDDWAVPAIYEGVWSQTGMVRHARRARRNDFATALVADGPSPELAEYARDLDWLVGGWSATVRDFSSDGRVHVSRGEWWFSWVLEGRAMQDVWISPPRTERGAARPAGSVVSRYGTTIRRFDRSRGAWRVTWINPATGAENELTGSRRGDSIVLLGTADGRPIRWQLVEIRADSFTWQGYQLEPDGTTWRLQAEFELERIDLARSGRVGSSFARPHLRGTGV